MPISYGGRDNEIPSMLCNSYKSVKKLGNWKKDSAGFKSGREGSTGL